MFTPLTLTYWIVLAFVCALLACRKPSKKDILNKNKNELFKKTHANNFTYKSISPISSDDLKRLLSRLSDLPSERSGAEQGDMESQQMPNTQRIRRTTESGVHGLGNK